MAKKSLTKWRIGISVGILALYGSNISTFYLNSGVDLAHLFGLKDLSDFLGMNLSDNPLISGLSLIGYALAALVIGVILLKRKTVFSKMQNSYLRIKTHIDLKEAAVIDHKKQQMLIKPYHTNLQERILNINQAIKVVEMDCKGIQRDCSSKTESKKDLHKLSAEIRSSQIDVIKLQNILNGMVPQKNSKLSHSIEKAKKHLDLLANRLIQFHKGIKNQNNKQDEDDELSVLSDNIINSPRSYSDYSDHTDKKKDSISEPLYSFHEDEDDEDNEEENNDDNENHFKI